MLHHFQDVTPTEFLAAFARVKRTTSLSPVDELMLYRVLKDGGRLRLSDDGLMGYIITKRGDLRCVFNTGPKGMGAYAVQDAIHCGAKTLDAFDGLLVHYYKRFGFKELYRVKFDPLLAPSGFDLTTSPDVVFMALEHVAESKERMYGLSSKI